MKTRHTSLLLLIASIIAQPYFTLLGRATTAPSLALILSSWHPVRVYVISKQSYVNTIKTGINISFNVFILNLCS